MALRVSTEIMIGLAVGVGLYLLYRVMGSHAVDPSTLGGPITGAMTSAPPPLAMATTSTRGPALAMKLPVLFVAPSAGPAVEAASGREHF